jgi:hypothetical protein
MNRSRQAKIHQTLRTDANRFSAFERSMRNPGSCTKTCTPRGALSAAEEQSKSTAAGGANCGILSGLLALTWPSKRNDVALNLVIPDAVHLKHQLASSLYVAVCQRGDKRVLIRDLR